MYIDGSDVVRGMSVFDREGKSSDGNKKWRMKRKGKGRKGKGKEGKGSVAT